MNNLVIIHNKVRDIDSLIKSLSSNTKYVIVSSFESADEFQLKVKDYLDVEFIGLIFDNTGKRAPFFELTREELNASKEYIKSGNFKIPAVPEFSKSGKFFSKLCLEQLSIFKNVSYIDLISCNVKSDDTFLPNMRYSTNPTGMKGDWIMESHNINITSLYFNDIITSYPHTLGIKTDPPTTISTAEDLYNLMLSTDSTVLSQSYTLANDIDMTGYLSETIGKNLTSYFSGSFNGQGYTVSIAETVSSGFGGLFGAVFGGSITNLNVNYLKSSGSDDIRATIIGCEIIPGILLSGGFATANLGFVENCNLVYSGNVLISGTGCAGFCGTVSYIGFGPFNYIQNCNMLCKKNIAIESIQFTAGFCSYINNSKINNCSFNVLGTASFTSLPGGFESGAFCGRIDNGQAQINNCNFTIYYDTVITSDTNAGSMIGSVSNSASVNGLTAFFASNTSVNGSSSAGSIGYMDLASTVENCNVCYYNQLNIIGTNVGGLIGNCDNSTVNFSNAICSNEVNLGNDSTTYTGGIMGYNNGGTTSNCAVISYGNTFFDGTNVAGICSQQNGTFTDCVGVYYGNYFLNGRFDPKSATFNVGSGTNCYSTSYDPESVIIPYDDHQDVTNTLDSNAKTSWLNNLINLHYQTTPVNDSGNISTILTDNGVATLAKNNAIIISFQNGFGYVEVPSSVIEPLLVKYISPLPSNINYALIQSGSLETSILSIQFRVSTQGMSYFGQGITDLGFNVLAISDTNGDGSVFFNGQQVLLGDSYDTPNFTYVPNGVGSSLLYITPKTTPPKPTSSGNNTAITLIIIGLVLLVVAFLAYYWFEYSGVVFLSLIASIVLVVISVVLFS